jgi:2-(1,2-epoxy-1,2-dihydrophenyl)acetyl-CoA isomerase
MTTTASTNDSPAVSAVHAFYAALGSGDIPAALARLGDTVSWHEAPGMPYQGPEPYHGAQQVAEHVLARITADVDGLTLTNREVLGLGTTVAVLGSYAGTAHRSGQPLTLPYLHIWTVIDDRITEFRQYTDTAAYRATLG